MKEYIPYPQKTKKQNKKKKLKEKPRKLAFKNKGENSNFSSDMYRVYKKKKKELNKMSIKRD